MGGSSILVGLFRSAGQLEGGSYLGVSSVPSIESRSALSIITLCPRDGVIVISARTPVLFRVLTADAMAVWCATFTREPCVLIFVGSHDQPVLTTAQDRVYRLPQWLNLR